MTGRELWNFELGSDHVPLLQWKLSDPEGFEAAVQIQAGRVGGDRWYVRHMGFGVRTVADEESARRAIRDLMARHRGGWEEAPVDSAPFLAICPPDGSRVLQDPDLYGLAACWGDRGSELWDEFEQALGAGEVIRRTEAHGLLEGRIDVVRYADPNSGEPRYALTQNLDAGGDSCWIRDYPTEDAAVRSYLETVCRHADPELPYSSTDIRGVDYDAPIVGRPEIPDGLALLPDGSICDAGDEDEWRYLWGRPRSDWPLTPPSAPGKVRGMWGAPRDWLPARVDVREVTPAAWRTDRFDDLLPNALALAALPDGRMLLASAHDGAAHLWNIRDGKLLRSFTGHTEWVLDAALTVTGDGSAVLATAGKEGTVRIWSARDGSARQRLDGSARQQLGGSRWPINAVAWACPPGKDPWVVAAGDDGAVRAWSVEFLREKACFENGPLGINNVFSVAAVVLANDHVCIAAAADDSVESTVRIWDATTERKIHEFVVERTPRSRVPKVALATLEDGSFRVAASAGTAVCVWDGLTGELIRSFPLSGDGPADIALAVQPDLRTAVAATNGPLTLVWDVESGAELARLDHGTAGFHQAVALATRPDGGLILAAARAGDRPVRVLSIDVNW